MPDAGNVSVTGSVPIIAGSGAGTYEGIKGNFKLTATLDEIVPKQTNCSADSTMLGQVIVITGWGRYHLSRSILVAAWLGIKNDYRTLIGIEEVNVVDTSSGIDEEEDDE